jgi:hypothetical protein
MGLVWFTKYYIRIQAVIPMLIRDNPLRAMALIATNGLVDTPNILDSSMLTHSPLNLGAGAFEWLSSIRDIVTIKMIGKAL